MHHESKSSKLFPSEVIPCVAGIPCERCAEDQLFLRSKEQQRCSNTEAPVRMVDLFAGCGGMSIGLVEAGRRMGVNVEVALAVDSDDAVLTILRRNLPVAVTRNLEVEKLFDGVVGSAPTLMEQEVLRTAGQVDLLTGGPPCQGHSDLNNHTRRQDPKNGLYLTMARAAEILRPTFVIIENVATVQWDKSRIAQQTIDALQAAGYDVAANVVDLRLLGVPQRRHRFLLLASRTRDANPSQLLQAAISEWKGHPARTVRWAIEDLLEVASDSVFDTASARSAANVRRMAYLFKHGIYDLPNSKRPHCHRDGNHSYRSVYGRLRWSQPAQTITTGFGSMGQGRYVHPQRRRTLTPHEAARLQCFPDWFDFGRDTLRGVLAKAIGNAVPPFVTLELGRRILPVVANCRESAAFA
jgi:DNA (cytosine-5)-methyltransferase 1